MIRFGVIGTNKITEAFIEAASQVDDFMLSAVYSRTEERAKEFASKYNVQHTFTNIEFMAQSKQVDAVYIASPTSSHAEQAVLLMNNGVHVLCEKPIASNVNELEKMIQAAKKNNVILMEALKSTLLPTFKTIQENLHKIGTVRNYFASYCQYSSRYDAYKAGTILNAFNPAYSNGALMDIGVYCIYPMVVLFGKPESLQANALLLDSGVDGQGSLLFKYKEMTGSVMYSKISNSYVPSEIQGEEGSLIIDHIDKPNNITLIYKDGTSENLPQTLDRPIMYYEVKEFIDLIQMGQSESVNNSLTHSMQVMELLDETRKQIGLVFPADL